jgi:hypothetical protein
MADAEVSQKFQNTYEAATGNRKRIKEVCGRQILRIEEVPKRPRTTRVTSASELAGEHDKID